MTKCNYLKQCVQWELLQNIKRKYQKKKRTKKPYIITETHALEKNQRG